MTNQCLHIVVRKFFPDSEQFEAREAAYVGRAMEESRAGASTKPLTLNPREAPWRRAVQVLQPNP